MARIKQADYLPPPSLIETEKENNSLAYGFGIVVAVGIIFLSIVIAAQIGFGEQGMRVALLGGSAIMVISIVSLLVWTFVSLGAEISLRATRTSASVFMRADVVDAYTDKIRMESARGVSSQQEIVTVTPPFLNGPPSSYLDLQLPPPRDQLTF